MIQFYQDFMEKPMPRQLVTDNEVFFKEDQILVSKTDTKGKITYCNTAFINISGYSEIELLGKPHSIMRHPDMPRSIYKLLWNTIKAGQEINTYVKNLCKDGSFYWVFANVTPSFNANNEIIGYFSARRKPKKESVLAIEDIYKKLLDIEKRKGMEDAYSFLHNFIKQKGTTYEQFILSI